MADEAPLDESGLRARVAELSARLAEARAALAAAEGHRQRADSLAQRNERLERIGERAGLLGHDLNNAFAPILMAVALLNEKVTDEKGLRMLAVLESNAQRGAALVREVLSLARGEDPVRAPARPGGRTVPAVAAPDAGPPGEDPGAQRDRGAP